MTIKNQPVALVTGASSGIGYATAEMLAESGYRVFGASRRSSTQAPAGVIMLTADVTDDTSVATVVKDVLAQTGRIDLLVNNAGIGVIGGAEESSISQAQALFDVNVFGVMRWCARRWTTLEKRGASQVGGPSDSLSFSLPAIRANRPPSEAISSP